MFKNKAGNFKKIISTRGGNTGGQLNTPKTKM